MSKEKLNEEVEEKDSSNSDENEGLEDKPQEDIASDENGLEKELEENRTRLLRLQADFDNYKKRVEKEKIQIVQFASSELIEKLLPVLDNFDRALAEENKKKDDKNEGLFEGVQMIRNQLIEALESEGVKEIEAFEKPFDPNYHNAIQQIESNNHDSNTVVEVYQKGYQFKDRVIRPSMVVVSK